MGVAVIMSVFKFFIIAFSLSFVSNMEEEEVEVDKGKEDGLCCVSENRARSPTVVKSFPSVIELIGVLCLFGTAFTG